jgi:putative polyketide hydroxylase
VSTNTAFGSPTPQNIAQRTRTDVVIVGAGPAGLATAHELARHGVRSVVVDRRPEPNRHPRAGAVNTRSMELFRLWGVDDDVRASAFPQERLPFDMLVPFGGISFAERREISPVMFTRCAQDRVETALVRGLSRPDRRDLCDIRWSTTMIDLTNRGDGVTITVSSGGGQAVEVIDARWCVAADGARSPIREMLGIDLVGDRHIGSQLNIYVEGELTPGVEAPLTLPSRDPSLPGVAITLDGKSRWLVHVPYNRAKEGIEDYPLERCRAIVSGMVNDGEDLPIEVVSVNAWTITAVVAERFRSGSVFLVGDAAHAFPPTGGLGQNTSIQDGHNLAWKLAAVLHAQAGEELLDSYEAERAPIAYLNTWQSMFNNEMSRGQLGGLDGDPRDSHTNREVDLIGKRASTSVRSLARVTTDPKKREELAIVEHASSIGLDLGFAYLGSPVITFDGAPRPDILTSRYVPNACPGSRAPHLMVRSTADEEADSGHSILDHLLTGGFTLLTARPASPWHAVDFRGAPVEPTVLSVASDGDLVPVQTDFAALYGIGLQGAVLVRPDGHVAFRSAGSTDDVAGTLLHALAGALGRATF